MNRTLTEEITKLFETDSILALSNIFERELLYHEAINICNEEIECKIRAYFNKQEVMLVSKEDLIKHLFGE